MKKKLLFIAFILPICFWLGISICISNIFATKLDNKATYYENCNRSIELYDEVINQFKTKRLTRSSEDLSGYNDNFAGVFLDDKGLLNIGIVEEKNLLSFDDNVVYVQQEFSYNYLQTIKSALLDIVMDCDIYSIEIDEILNKVIVYASNQDAKNIAINYLQELNLYNKEALHIIVDSKFEIVPTAKTAYGGDKINDSFLVFLNSSGTICVNAYDNETGKYGVITNAHVAKAETTMYHNGNVFQGAKIGIATKRQQGGTLDAAFVPFENQDNWNVTTNAKSGVNTYTNIRLGFENLIIQGAPVRKIGQTSGDNTGTITNRDASIKLIYDSGEIEISNVIRYSNESLAGDSGGPVYFDGGDQNLFLIGMNFAGPKYPDVFTFGIGCRISNVMDAFNVTPVLNGTIFETTNLDNNKIRIDKLIPTIPKNSASTITSFDIPSQINGKTVTEIGSTAFSNQQNITNYTLPNTLEIIGSSAFKGCTSLKTVEIPNTVTNIDSSAFEDCTSLTNVTLSTSLTSIGSKTFKGCSLLETIDIPNTITHIDSSAFENCYYLQNITLPNSLLAIGSSAFKDCASLNTIDIPNTVTHIDSSAFENCYYLQNITLSNHLFAIGSSAFKGCESLNSIDIPSSVEYIDSNAFENCIQLKTVKVYKEVCDITTIGIDAFKNCHTNLTITVPINRVAEYKNKGYWSSYKNKIVPSSSNYDEINLHCLSDFNITTTLESRYNKLYKLNVACGKSYKITSPSSVLMNIYDANMTVLSSGEGMMNQYLSVGTYYMDFRFVSHTDSGNIDTKYELTWSSNGWNVEYNTENHILPHLHEINQDNYQTQLYYNNTKGAGLYQFTLTGKKDDGGAIIYKEGAITIYDNNNRIVPMDKLFLPSYSNVAKTSENADSMIVYLPKNGSFYINVNMTTNAFSELYLNITPVQSQDIDLFDLSETTNEMIDVFSETTKGDYFTRLDIHQTGKFTISTTYDGQQADHIIFVVAQLNYNNVSNTYTLATKTIQLVNESENIYTNTLILEEGIYYVGYFNKNDTNTFGLTINRLVNQYGSGALIPDPDSYTNSGSQIQIIEMNHTNKSYRQTYITKGFTRLIYPDSHYGISISRLDYKWYSSNDSIATVSEYGTVVGKNVGSVKIMAVLKTDPSKVFVKEFTIIDDRGSEPLVVNSEYKVKYSQLMNGTFQLNLEKVNCPYPWIQDYTWSIDRNCHNNNVTVSMDYWGKITVDKEGCFTLMGNYIKNSRVTIMIHVIVES